MTGKRWIIADTAPEEARAKFPEFSPVVLRLLWNRGLRSQEDVDVFLGPDWARDTFPPSLFREMPRAVARVFDALARGEVITVHGDYDADGVCGSVVLMSTLREICRALGYDEKKLTVYLPHREKEGYGVSVPTVEHLSSGESTKLLITVDCGISNGPAIARGKELGMDTIVCDHHTMPPELPTEAILLHPLVPGETFPNKHLCGTGVAFKLASGLIDEARIRGAAFPDGYEKWLLDLVAIATVTDVMPLTGENRALEHYGLLVLNKVRRVGVQKLCQIAGVTPGKIETWTIGFQLGPRLNAAGRMDHASAAFNLLMCEDEVEAERLAHALNQANMARQKASDKMYQEAKAQVGEVGERKVLVVWAEGWPAGLVGLVAGKLVGDFGLPTYVVGKDGEKFVGSGRSIPGFDVTKALHAAATHLDKFGGHPQACGFSTSGEARFAQFRAAVEAYAAETLGGASLAPIVNVDAEVSSTDISWDVFEAMAKMQPFGEANREPVFASTGLRLVSFETMGADGKHLKFLAQFPDGKTKRFVAFGFGRFVQMLNIGAMIDVAFQLSLNEWNGNRELQCRVVDLRYAQTS